MQDIDQLEQQRSLLYERLAQTGDFRRGTIGATYRRCGKTNCACADPRHPGHGPRHRLTRSLHGRTESIELRTPLALEKASREVANHRRFTALSQEIVEINERICEARPPGQVPGVEPRAGAGAEKGGSSGTSGPRSQRR
ncbi:MAG: hypothetical protein C0506_16890 [Anaerolinea sp.]|nr:hypothetical protein [Anaerolinea sp.]